MSLYLMPASDAKRNAQRTTPSRAPRGETLTQLVARAQSGDMRSFDALVARFQDRAVGRSAAILGDAFGAQDVAQEAFSEAYCRLGELKIPAAFPSLLEALIRKHCDRVTRRRCFVTVSLGSLGEPSGNDDALIADDPALRVIAEAQRESVREAVHALPDAEREIILLFYVGGQSHKEIAAALNLPVSTIKSRLHEGRAKLKRRMIPMIEETLAAEQPSRSEIFRKNVANAAPVRRHWSTDDGTPRIVNAETERKREVLETRAATAENFDFQTAREGYCLLLIQCGDFLAAAEFLERYLAQPGLTPSEQAWAKHQQLFCLAEGWGRPSFVMRHRAFLLWLDQQFGQYSIHLADGSERNGFGYPVAPDAPDCIPADCLPLWGVFVPGAEFIWRNVGRLEEWFAIVREVLARAPQNAMTRPYRHFLIAGMIYRLAEENRHEERWTVITELERLADEAEADAPQWDTPRYRIRASQERASAIYDREKGPDYIPSDGLRQAVETTLALVDAWATQISTLDVDAPSTILLGERPEQALTLARELSVHLLGSIHEYDRAISVCHQLIADGFGGNDIYFLCAQTVWKSRRDRAETLSLLRQAAEGTFPEHTRRRFRNAAIFRDIQDDPEFLAALSGEVTRTAALAA